MIKIPEFIRRLKPYKAGKPIDELAREKGLTHIVKLASNENPLGPSPKAMAAAAGAADKMHRYTDPACFEMVSAFSQKYRVQPQHIICGHGADSLLRDIINAFTVEQDELLTSEGTFIGIYVNVNKLGRNLATVPLSEYAYDLDAILAAINPKTRIIYLANPNNPTGTMFGRTEFEKFMDRVPEDVLVVLDEAYTSYAKKNPEYPNGVHYDYDNMIVVRTLAKEYGLAGFRVGFAIGPKYLIDVLYKVRLPFEPNLMAQKAAIAALDDDRFLDQTIAVNRTSLKILQDALIELRIRFVPTTANFILMIMPSELFAEMFFEECLNHGLIVRHTLPFGVPEGIRINSGTEEETRFAVKVIEQVYTSMLNEFSRTIPQPPQTRN